MNNNKIVERDLSSLYPIVKKELKLIEYQPIKFSKEFIKQTITLNQRYGHYSNNIFRPINSDDKQMNKNITEYFKLMLNMRKLNKRNVIVTPDGLVH